MFPVINYDIFWSVLAALIAYDIISNLLRALFNRPRYLTVSSNDASSKHGGSGIGPGGMVVKGRDSLVQPKPEEKTFAQ